MSCSEHEYAGGVCRYCGADQPKDEYMDELTREYVAYCEREGLPDVDAEEQIHGELTPEQRHWLSDFILRWEAMQD